MLRTDYEAHSNCCRKLLEKFKEYIIHELPKQELADGSNHIRNLVGLKSKVKKPLKGMVAHGMEDLFTKFSAREFAQPSSLQRRMSDGPPSRSSTTIPEPPHDSTRRLRRRSEVSPGSKRSDSAKRVAREAVRVTQPLPMFFGEHNTAIPSRPTRADQEENEPRPRHPFSSRP
jgi:hypothetical protein